MLGDFYELTGGPFQITPDPAFHFKSFTHSKALSYLDYGLRQGEGVILVTGETGLGKSLLISCLLETIDLSGQRIVHIVSSQLNDRELVFSVARAFGLVIDVQDKAAAQKVVEEYLRGEAQSGHHCLLIVDDAQHLSRDALDELRLLTNLQSGPTPLLQVLLLGLPELRDRLFDEAELEPLRQRLIVSHRLDAMGLDEVGPYVVHRLNCAGWSGNPAFDDDVFAGIFAATHGNPRQINQVVNRMLLLGAIEQRTRFDGSFLQQVMAELEDDDLRPARRNKTILAVAGEAQTAGLTEYVTPVLDIDTVAPLLAEHPVFANAIHAFIEMSFAQRDVQITELEQAMMEIANAAEMAALPTTQALHRDIAVLMQRIATLEETSGEQENMLRHALTMVIEWIETDDRPRAAA